MRKTFFPGCIMLYCCTGLLYSNQADPTEHSPRPAITKIPIVETCGRDEFIFKLDINSRNKLAWNREFSPQEYVAKAEKFIKEHIGGYAKDWEVCEFQINILDQYSYRYVVTFVMIPEGGVLNGLPGFFRVYMNSSGEIDVEKKSHAERQNSTPQQTYSGGLFFNSRVEQCGRDEFVFKLKPSENKLAWNRVFSPQKYVEKAEKFIKEHIGEQAKNWTVCEFDIRLLSLCNEQHPYYYVVAFSKIPENGKLNGKPGVFHVYMNSSGEIDVEKK